MTERRRYDDKFRASAVVMLRAAGYPDKKGALTDVAKHIGVQPRVLSRWFTGEQNPPPDQVVSEKATELKDMLDAELAALFGAMPAARAEATYRDLGVVGGILMDKKLLLEGKPTDRVAIQNELTDAERAARIASLFDKARTRRTGSPDLEADDAGGG
jgi:hypothetical protein